MEDPKEATLTEHPNESPAVVTSTTKSHRTGQRVTFCAVGSIVALIVIIIIVWLSFNPSVSSPEFQISSISVSSPLDYSSSPSSPLNANWKITFLVRTPTDLNRISYDRFEVTLLYRGIFISSVSISPFYQHKGDEGLVEATMAALTVDNNYNTVRAIYDALKDGAVNFTVVGDAMVRVKHGFMKGHWHHLKVFCDNVMVGFCSNGSRALVGGSARCKTDIKRRIWEPL